MKKMDSTDVITTYVEFVEGNGRKRRPIVVLKDDGENIYCFRITTQYYSKSKYFREKYYYPILNWKQMGLYKQSYIDTYKPYAISKANWNKIYKIGKMDDNDYIEMVKFALSHEKEN